MVSLHLSKYTFIIPVLSGAGRGHFGPCQTAHVVAVFVVGSLVRA